MIEVWVLIISLFGPAVNGPSTIQAGPFQSELLCEKALRGYEHAFTKHDKSGFTFRRVVICVQTQGVEK